MVIGAYTHVILDAFTHSGRWGTRRVAALTAYVGPLPTYKWLQFGLGALGLLVPAVWAVVWLDEADPRPTPSTQLSSSQRTTVWMLILQVFFAAGAVTGLSGIQDGLSTESVAVRVATGTMSLTVAVAVRLCLLWHVDARLRPSTEASR